jgi:predicted RNA binding protein YcfA (HicA-like mRNA interferase family)
LNVPIHEGSDLKPGTLFAILKRANMTIDELRNLL